MESLRLFWSKSKWYRVALIVAVLWFLLRLAVQIIYASGWLPELTGDGGLPMDLPVYIGAAQKFFLHQTLYPQDLSDSTYHYPYSPPFAMLSGILLLVPARWIAVAGTVLSVVIYAWLYFSWIRIFRHLSLNTVIEKMVYTLPVWLIFSAFWGGVVFLNIGLFVALIATLLIEGVLGERLTWSAVLATFLLISKIMWAFPLALPLLLGRRKFFLKLIGLTALFYLLLVGAAFVVAGPDYILRQYAEYFMHLKRLGNEFPWHLHTVIPFLGYNHSIKQAFIFWLGAASWVVGLATAVKLIILLPLAFICWRLLFSKQSITSTHLQIELAFALYLGAFVWLDIVWEVLLGIVIFPYLLTILTQKWEKVLVWGIFLIYALVDAIQFFSYIIGGDSVVVMQGAYILTDPSLYIPLTMLVILVFYGFIIRQLWPTIRETAGKISDQ